MTIYNVRKMIYASILQFNLKYQHRSKNYIRSTNNLIISWAFFFSVVCEFYLLKGKEDLSVIDLFCSQPPGDPLYIHIYIYWGLPAVRAALSGGLYIKFMRC